ncbi:porin [Succinatimonas hippei]|uniref:porin n=1 Tax=Succinatimonas hippei TaxID=626938 RepID=UPI00201249B2|nr:porin [Succinatimonas hippei]MCL1603485.1 porin [Succinatimonas hippei]MDM8119956.1 porin [Succinatimonas hippei]
MRKSVLALAVAVATASFSSSAATVYENDGTSLEVYGRIQAVAYSKDAAQSGQPASGDGSVVGSGRLGFQMRSQLTEGIAGFANVEWDVSDSDSRETFDARDLYVGADFGQFGSVKAGRFRDALYQGVESTTDVFDDFGCNGQLGNDDRRDGSFMYSWSGYGVDFYASYATAKDNEHIDGAFYHGYNEDDLDVKNSFAVALGYTTPDVLFGPISVKAGYGYTQFQDDAFTVNGTPNDAEYDNYKQWAVALSWGDLAQGPYLAALYQARSFEMNTDVMINGKVGGKTFSFSEYTVSGAEGVAGYTFANGVTILAGVEWMNIESDDGDDIDVSSFTAPLYVNYKVTPNFNVWAEGRINLDTYDEKNYSFKMITKGAYNNMQDVVSVGARYTF